jgi:hypothetical protein
MSTTRSLSRTFVIRIISIFLFLTESNLQEQRCFAADSIVTLSDGNQKLIADLQSGDSILAYHDKTKNIVSTHLLTMLDFQPHRFGKIY